MSTSPETDFDLDLHFLPAWAQESPDQNRYAKYAGEAGKGEARRGDRRDRPRREPRKERGPREQRPAGGPRPPRPEARGPQERGGRKGGDYGRRETRPAPAPLPELNVAFVPEDKGVDSLAKQIKMTGRAYPLFEIAQMILQKPERHTVTISVRKKPDGAPAQPLFVCALDDSLWLSEEDAVRYVLNQHFNMFYQPERTGIEPPKGTYTFVAQCGMSGVILGPPNYHDYQNQLRKLHAERFSRMPFEAFKSRVKIVRDEAVVKKWIDDQSWKTEYICLNMPEPLKLGSRDDVEAHFRQTHLPNIIKPVESYHLTGTASRNLKNPALMRLLRQTWEDQKRFPLQVATILSQQFAAHGLQFFKVNKTVTHVAVARPHYLDLDAAPISESVKRVVDYVQAHPKCTRRQLLEALAPVPPAAEGAAPEQFGTEEPTPEMTQVISDLHWLVHQGHVIEFANGGLETAKKPAPRPERPAPQPKAEKTETPAAENASGPPAAATPGGDANATSPESAAASPENSAAAAESAAPPDAVPSPAAEDSRVEANAAQPVETAPAPEKRPEEPPAEQAS